MKMVQELDPWTMGMLDRMNDKIIKWKNKNREVFDDLIWILNGDNKND